MRRALHVFFAVPAWILVAQACGDIPETMNPAAGGSATMATVGHSGAGSGGQGGHGGAASTAATATSVVVTAGGGALPGDGGAHFCDLPGSIVQGETGVETVPGAPPGTPDLSYLHIPEGFCAHYFGNVGNARQVRFAPNGELFVASPTTGTTGGGPNGKAAIVILPDADQDGFADAPITYLDKLPSTQGLLFTKDYLYYQDGTKIRRVPYKAGDHAPSGPSEQMIDVTIYSSSLHWPKALDQADDGTIYVGNGGDQGESCDPAHPFHGGILAIDGTPGGTPIAKGCRNPIAVRCQKGYNRCYASELSRDYSADLGGREKIIPIHQGDDWGFPCCATKDLPYPDIQPVPSCGAVTPDTNSFIIGDTPFGVEFEGGLWPGPFSRSMLVTLHGAAGSWKGARVVAIGVDPATGLPLPATSKDGSPSGAMVDFASGWDDGTHAHGRPAALTFAADGRLFITNDTNGDIVWIAPITL